MTPASKGGELIYALMHARQSQIVFLLLAGYVAGLPASAQTSPAQSSSAQSASAQGSKKRSRKQAAKPEEPPPAPQPPPPPPTLEQMPAVAPQVFFRNGQLTIVARNSTLGDILRAVHMQTGASVDVPPNATERVVSNLGPGPARDVLASLLNGSHFNYVMLGSPNDPQMVQRIILTSKSGGAGENAPPTTSEAANQQQVYPPQAVPPPEAEEMPVEEVPDESTPEVDQAEQPGQEEQQIPNGQQQVKTPEQLLQELQRQQREQQQQPGAPQGFPQNQPQIQPQPQPQPQQNPPQ